MEPLKQSLLAALLVSSLTAEAKLNVVATTTDLRALAAEVGGSDASIESIAKGSQDPHFIEAKPSYMVRIHNADLVVSVGLDLEIGWLPSILQGGRNPKVMPGQPGYLEVGQLVETIEKPAGSISRADGDVHPFGNPHFTLDPIRAGLAAVGIAKRMGHLDPTHAVDYLKRGEALKARLEAKTKEWKTRIEKSGVKDVVSYHKTLSYFFDRFGIANPAILEPKPGIPPTTSQTLKVISIIREKKINLVMVENYFDANAVRKIQSEVPGLRLETVPVAVDGSPDVKSIDDLYEVLVRKVEGK